jgi:hypothetical protein
MDVQLLDDNGNSIDMDALAKEADKEERRINTSIRNLAGEESATVQTGVDEDISMTTLVNSGD